ncbi:two-component system regulatory protein YycI [Bombilactobacillus thymidiniphilus]|uniref:Two-component system regulatory protein YycI n=1 Tax=Bombilactobacillus thymidiniphilus TaxID=2923363 RepID=A0ABY4PF74_9LACO|nr:two-component system regulatory protein YycI [Bombilactobacillus thymidiniphilus]UQS84293.1 two-component system regulatory protein YycI [Bombilactobacillus thymidiniphilus]
MDFRRIEAIFLIVFIFLDIFLFTSYTQARNSVVITSNNGHATLEKEMAQDNITVSGKLSTKTGSGYYLASQNSDHTWHNNQTKLHNVTTNYDADKNLLTVALNSPVTLPADHQKQAIYVQRFLNKPHNAIFGDQYKYAPYLSSKNDLIYVQKLKWGTLYESEGNIEVKISNQRLISYEQTYVDAVSVLREKQTTISEQRAVNNLYTNNEIPSNSQIKWTRQGYAKLLKVKGSTIYIPVWYVCFLSKGNKTSEIRKVNAFNGTIVKSNNFPAVNDDE